MAIPSVKTIAQGWSLEPVEITPMGSDIRMRGRVVYPEDSEGGA